MILEIKGKKIHYEKTGTGPALVMIHGNSESLGIFTESAMVLKERFTVYAMDLPGHGESEKIKEFHYNDLASYVYDFIKAINLEKPVFFGFSDGGIIGLLLALKYPDLFSRLIISGVNINPNGLKSYVRLNMWTRYLLSFDNRIKMMLHEPNITSADLSKIKIPVDLTVGENDVVPMLHTKFIADSIHQSSLTVFKCHTHGSYIVHNTAIAKYILNLLNENETTC